MTRGGGRIWGLDENAAPTPSPHALCLLLAINFLLVLIVIPHAFSHHFPLPPLDQCAFGATREGNPLRETDLLCLNEIKIDCLPSTGQMTIDDDGQS